MTHDSPSLAQVIETLEQGLPPAPNDGFLGARLDPRQARLVLLPVPWEVTTSYGGGTADGPDAIVRASHQLDLEDGAFDRPYRAGISFLPQPEGLRAMNDAMAPLAEEVITAVERGARAEAELAQVNAAGEAMNAAVYRAAMDNLEQGRLLGLVGGDHACPFGLIQALARHESDGFGILHIDAHHDLRAAYEGFVWSHASIFFNVMQRVAEVSRLVQVGIRDYSRAEKAYMVSLGERGRVFYDRDLFRRQAQGEDFASIVADILDALPQRVYVSFDIDGLQPAFCPHTGTPVPGGLSFNEACYLLEQLALGGKILVGFDLCEVAPAPNGDEWDANVGARVLYKLCGALLHSRGFC